MQTWLESDFAENAGNWWEENLQEISGICCDVVGYPFNCLGTECL